MYKEPLLEVYIYGKGQEYRDIMRKVIEEIRSANYLQHSSLTI
jgi:hypothetical protein